ncbi:MAG: rhodanese-like domain-containing protein [Planctomycetes bacterium]|nr:rhodanese-like domain-containing protein [Planctomycetota bacterium]
MSAQKGCSVRMLRPRSLVTEALLLAATSLAVALIVISIRGNGGLQLSRDHFPADSLGGPEAEVEIGRGKVTENGSKPEHGYQSLTVDDAQVYQPYAEARDGIVFLDARSKKLYEAGHIPGARLCHHYRQDEYLPALLDELRAADLVIIYCAGGDCEDSIQLATDLVFIHGLSHEVIAIYEGGYEEWVNHDLAVATAGERG